ncbi:36519_t:CDS:1, partial [Gigaspora margarita]
YFNFNTLTKKHLCKKCEKPLKQSNEYQMREHVSKCFEEEFKEIINNGNGNEVYLKYEFTSQYFDNNNDHHKILNEFTIDNDTKKLVCKKCNYEYSSNPQIFTLKKHFMDTHPE